MNSSASRLLSRRKAAWTAGVLAVAGVLAGLQAAQDSNPTVALKRETQPVARGKIEGASFSDVVKRASPSVVKITTRIGAHEAAAGANAFRGFDHVVDAGLKGGDVITAVNGQPVTDANDLKLKVSALSPGTKLNLEVLRYGEKTQLNSDASQDGSAWFVRVIDPRHGSIWVKAPPDWVQAVVQRIPIPEWGVTAEREIPTVRLPQDALRDYAVASRTLFDGRLIQAGRSTDSSAVLLAPLRRAFGGVGAAVLILSVAVGTLFAWRATRPLREVSDTARRILETGDFAARVPAPDGSDAVVITVTDNGPGVPPAEREAIFRRLYRGDASRSQRGLGLGLSLVKAFLEAHGGTVAIDAALGGGAHFTIRLPR